MRLLEKIRNQEIRGYLTTSRRIVFPGAVYHITQRAPGREIVFVEDGDYLKFLSELKKTVKRFKLELFCFSLLENHLHLLLQIKERNLSEAMQILFGKYATYFNYKYERKGHVFCGRFRSSLVNHDSYLLAASCYIHLNPFNAGLTEYFNKYRWSSLSLYTEDSKRTFINHKKILNMIHGDLNIARKKYLELLRQSAKIKDGNFIDSKKVKRFVEKAKNKAVKFNKEISELDRMIEKFKENKRLKTPEEKKSRKYLIEQLISNGNSINEIAGLLHLSRQTIHTTLKSEH
jgi:putative transposase